jgi:hypothetical protein
MKKLILFAALFAAANGFAQTEVTDYKTENKKPVEGVVYALPRNQIIVTVKAAKHTYTPGEFCQYAGSYLRLKNVSPDPKVTWKISEITAEEKAIPDSSKVYFIKMKKGTVAPLIQLSEKGLIEAINCNAEKIDDIPVKSELVAEPAKMLNPHDLLTQDVVQAGSSAKMAELVSQEIFKMRDTKNSLLSGDLDNMPKDGASMQIMLNQLNDQDKALSSLFSGTTSDEAMTYTFVIDPQNGDYASHVLFRFSEKRGVVDADDLGGDPIEYKIENEQSIVQKTIDPKVVKKDKKGKYDGVVYNVPSKAKFTVYNEDKVYFSSSYMIAQYGNIETLLNDLFSNKKEKIKVQFDSLTGGLLKVDKESVK